MVSRQLRSQYLFAANQNHFNRQMADSAQRSVDFWFGSVVTTHRIDSDGHQRSWHRAVYPLLLSDFDYGTALVVPAGRANAVRHLGRMAVGAFRLARLHQVIMGAAH
jgi:hypothetical protein